MTLIIQVWGSWQLWFVSLPLFTFTFHSESSLCAVSRIFLLPDLPSFLSHFQALSGNRASQPCPQMLGRTQMPDMNAVAVLATKDELPAEFSSPVCPSGSHLPTAMASPTQRPQAALPSPGLSFRQGDGCEHGHRTGSQSDR